MNTDMSSVYKRLNNNQRSILELLCRGLRNAEIATALGMKERTVKYYNAQLFLLFDVTNRTELVGLLSPGMGIGTLESQDTQSRKVR